ncbi:Protein of unknown function [Thermobacillus xylanilyticus]|jgi:hypothetical protein
MKA